LLKPSVAKVEAYVRSVLGP